MELENDIAPRALKLYDLARIEAVAALRQNFEVKAIYELGTVKAPGISDLDLMTILDRDEMASLDVRSMVDVLPDSVKTLLNGSTLMVLDTELFSTIRIWDDIRTKHLWGQKLELNQVQHPQMFLQLARAVDWIPERTLRLGQMMQMETVKTSRALGLIYSLCHSLRMVLTEFNPTNASEIRAFVARIDRLRNSWFQTDSRLRDLALRESIEDGLEIGKKLIHVLAGRLSNIGLIDHRVEGELSLGQTGRMLFRNADGDVGAGIDGDSIVLPTIFYQHFKNYAFGDGMISESIRRSLLPDSSLRSQDAIDGYAGLLGERLEWIERQAELLTSLGFSTGLFKFGWFFSPSARGVS